MSAFPDGTDAPDDIVLAGFRTQGVKVIADANNVLLQDIDGGAFDIWGKDLDSGPRNVTVKDSDWGPCYVPDYHLFTEPRCNEFDEPGDGKIKIYNATNVVIQGNRIHDFLRDNSSPSHFECVAVWNVSNLTVRGNMFDRCNTNAIAQLGSGNDIRGTWIFEENWFGESAAGSALKFAQLPPAGTVIIRNNSFQTRETIVDEEPQNNSSGKGKIHISRNILGNVPYYGGLVCIQESHGAIYSSNLWIGTSGRTCDGTGNRVTILGYSYSAGRLVRDQRAASAIQRAFNEVAEDVKKPRTLRAVARDLARARIVAPRGGWTRQTLLTVLSDSVYLGRRLGIPGKHPAIVTRRTWNAAQRAIAATRS